MQNMTDYAWQNIKSFQELPFQELDAVILSWISYLQLEAVPELGNGGCVGLKELFRAELFPQLLDNVRYPERSITLLAAMVANPRFREMEVLRYEETLNNDNGTPIQFSAVTFQLAPGEYAVAFRGTDSNTAGWKEDFELALERSIPAQLLARDYVERLAIRGLQF